MAKGQVSDEELAAGLKSLGGGLGGIASTGARRDSPFATPAPRIPVPIPATSPLDGHAANKVSEKTIDVALKEETKIPPVKQVLPEVKATVKAVKPLLSHTKEKSVKEPVQAKSDNFSERITLQMSPEMRDELNDLARKLQRRKTDKSERITANTLMRASIQFMLDNLELGEVDRPNNEGEVLELFERRLK